MECKPRKHGSAALSEDEAKISKRSKTKSIANDNEARCGEDDEGGVTGTPARAGVYSDTDGDSEKSDHGSEDRSDDEDAGDTDPDEVGVTSGAVRPAKYLPDERVFAMDGEGVYEAVVRKARLRSSPVDGGSEMSHRWSYFVHYLGWASRWDRWIDEEDVRVDTEETRARAQSIKSELIKADEERRARAKERKEKQIRAKEARKAARKYEKDAHKLAIDDCCEIPFTLKTVLVDDRERITRLGRTAHGYDNVTTVPGWRPPRLVHVIPAPLTVRKVLTQYLKVKRRDTSKKLDEGKLEKDEAEEIYQKWTSFVECLCDIFDRSLPIWLLYHHERTHYLVLERNPSLQGTRKCELYGCEHLLRLFVQLPHVVLGVKKLLRDQSDIFEFGMNISDLILFLQKNRTACFKAKYRPPKEEELTENERMLIKRCSVEEVLV